MGLSDDEFKTKFDGNLKTFLNHMFEKHHGEIIYIDRHVQEASGDWHPETLAIHHEQFYCGAGTEQTKARLAARRAWEGKNKEKSLNDFLKDHGHVRTVVYEPKAASGAFNPRTDTLDDVIVAYFSLPAWVFEMHAYAILSDLYTLYCAAPLAAHEARHSRVESIRREANRLKYKETGRCGHH